MSDLSTLYNIEQNHRQLEQSYRTRRIIAPLGSATHPRVMSQVAKRAGQQLLRLSEWLLHYGGEQSVMVVQETKQPAHLN